MRVAFAGTPPFAARALAALVAGGHSIPLVLTQPDRPAGRGMRPTASAVALEAQRHALASFKPPTLRDPAAVARICESRPDVMVVAAYGLILPPEVLALPVLGCLNIHASLLPRWRGAAPIQRAILAGDAETGISIMRMDAGLDTGPVLLRKRLPIGERETAGSLTLSLAELGAAAIDEVLRDLRSFVPEAQDGSRATYAAKVAKAEARIDWAAPAAAVDRQVRAFNPLPGAEARLRGESLKVWEAFPVGGDGRPGDVLAVSPEGIVVACGTGAARLSVLQRAGSRRLPAAEFLRGFAVRTGERFEAPAAADIA